MGQSNRSFRNRTRYYRNFPAAPAFRGFACDEYADSQLRDHYCNYSDCQHDHYFQLSTWRQIKGSVNRKCSHCWPAVSQLDIRAHRNNKSAATKSSLPIQQYSGISKNISVSLKPRILPMRRRTYRFHAWTSRAAASESFNTYWKGDEFSIHLASDSDFPPRYGVHLVHPMPSALESIIVFLEKPY